MISPASGLLELATYVSSPTKVERYKTGAINILKSLTEHYQPDPSQSGIIYLFVARLEVF